MGKWINIDDLPSDRVEWDDICDAPSIDIVFCKECVFREEDAEAEMYRCLLISFPHWNRGEHFCADGEREGE